MFRGKIFLVLIVSFTMTDLARCQGAQIENIKFLTHDLGNSTYIDEFRILRGLPGGGRSAFFAELVRAMMLRTGEISFVEEVPFVRGLHLIEKQNNLAFFHLIQTNERLQKYKWVGPVYDSPSFFYEHMRRPTHITSVDDARRQASVCGVRGTYNLKWLQRHHFKNILVANSFTACLQLLDYGRVSLLQSTEQPRVLLERPLARKILRKTSLSNRHELMKDELPGMGYIAFSRNIPDTEIARWQRALDDIKETGLFYSLKQEFLGMPPTSASATSFSNRDSK